MKAKRTPTVVIASLLTITLGIIIPASASASSTSKNTAKSKASTASACYKGNLARTALNHSLEDTDNLLSVTASISSVVQEIEAPFPTVSTLAQKSSLLKANASTYAKLVAYYQTLQGASTILSNSTGNAYKNTLPVKVASGRKFVAQTSLNVFNANFVRFPIDDAGVVISIRNINENTANLVKSVDSAFATKYPTQAMQYYASAIHGVVQNLISYPIDTDSGFAVSVALDSSTWTYTDKSATDAWDRITSDASYVAADAAALTTIGQRMEISAQTALKGLPKC